MVSIVETILGMLMEGLDEENRQAWIKGLETMTDSSKLGPLILPLLVGGWLLIGLSTVDLKGVCKADLP